MTDNKQIKPIYLYESGSWKNVKNDNDFFQHSESIRFEYW